MRLKEDGGDLFYGNRPTLVMDRGIATPDTFRDCYEKR